MTLRTPRTWLLIGISVFLAGALVAAQQTPPPVFRGGVDIVHFDVSVLDNERVPIRGLTAADFTVLVDGQSQPIVAFDAVNLPTIDRTRAAWTREVAPDVATNRQDAQRVVVLLIDDCGATSDTSVLLKRIAHDVVNGLGPADRAAVIYTGWRRSGQEFTTDRALLTAAIERFASLAGATRPFGRFSAGAGTRISGPSLACLSPSQGPGDSAVMQALRNAAGVLQSQGASRKTVVLVSPRGYSVDKLGEIGVMNRLQETFAALQRANINVYQFNPVGLETDIDITQQFGEFADNTGGRAIAHTNTPWKLVPQMYRENSSYYVLGIDAGPAERRERFRRVEVNVSRPDVEVRARSGYFTRATAPTRPARNAPTPLERALGSGLPDSGLPMTLAVAPFANPDRKTATVLLVTGLDTADVADGDEVELDIRAFKTDWTQAAATSSRAVVTRRSGSWPAEFRSSLALPPGRYEVRAAMRHPATARTGSAFATVIVPEFGKDALTMSGVVLSPGSGGAMTSPAAAPETLPPFPTTVRQFGPSERLELFTRIYQGGKLAASPVEISARVVDDADRTVFSTASSVPAANFGPARQTTYRLELPVQRLAPGDYLLLVEATAGANVTSRKVRFSVRDDGAAAR